MSGKGPGPGIYTMAALRQNFEGKRAHKEQLALAVEFVKAGRGGPQAASAAVLGCTRSQVDTAVKKTASKVTPRAPWQILTPTETDSLVKWLLGSAQNDNLATEAEASAQVTKMLQCRRLANRRKRSGKPNAAVVELTAAEVRVGLDGGELSHTWFSTCSTLFHTKPSCYWHARGNLLV